MADPGCETDDEDMAVPATVMFAESLMRTADVVVVSSPVKIFLETVDAAATVLFEEEPTLLCSIAANTCSARTN